MADGTRFPGIAAGEEAFRVCFPASGRGATSEGSEVELRAVDHSGSPSGPLWVLVLLFAVLAVETAFFVTYGRFNIDEGMHLNAGRLLFDRGLFPYRDFPFSQSPGGPMLYGAGGALFGTSLLVGRSISALMSLAGVGAMVWFANRVEGRAAAALVLLLVIVTFPALWVFTQVRTEAPSIFFATLATIAWFFRNGAQVESPAGAGIRWALAPSLLVWATAFRLTYAVPLVFVCLLSFWELRRSPRALGWTVGIVGLNGVVAALPMLVFWQESFFHIVESQLSRAERLDLEELPPSARVWFFGQLETGFHAILLLSCFPLFELYRKARRGWRPSAAAVNPEPGSPLAFLLAMAALSYLPLLIFTLGFFQYFVNASLLLILAISISITRVARRSKSQLIAVSAVFATAWVASAAISLESLEKWVSTDSPTLGRLAAVRHEIEALTPDGCTMMTFETYLAVETGCDVTPGLEYSYFSFFPEMPVRDARVHGVLNRQLLLFGLRSDPPEYVALTRRAAKRISGREFDRSRPPMFESMRGRYRLMQVLKLPIGPVYRFWTEVYLYARTDL
jgi:hypothetical protein